MSEDISSRVKKIVADHLAGAARIAGYVQANGAEAVIAKSDRPFPSQCAERRRGGAVYISPLECGRLYRPQSHFSSPGNQAHLSDLQRHSTYY